MDLCIVFETNIIRVPYTCIKLMFQHLRQEKDEEIRCNTEIEQFLRTHQQELERKV